MRRCAAILTLVVTAGLPILAHAQPAPPKNEQLARSLFEQGMDHHQAKRYPQACPLLEQSLATLARDNTRYWLADCLEQTGMLASAQHHYSLVQRSARARGDEVQDRHVTQRLHNLAPRIPQLTVSVTPGEHTAATVKLNDKPLPRSDWGHPRPVDRGRHTVAATAPGMAPWSSAVVIDGEGTSVTVNIPQLAPRDDVSDGEGRGWGGLQIAGVATAIGGGGLMAASLGVILAAKSDYDSVSTECDGNLCSAQAAVVRNDARAQGDIATALVAAGAAITAGGGALWLAGTLTNDEDDTTTAATRIGLGLGSIVVTAQW